MKWPDRVTVYHKLAAVPENDSDSFILDVLMLSEQHRRPAARCVEDIVLYDYTKGRKLKFESRPFMLHAFQETYRLQEEEKRRTATRLRELSFMVRQMEKDSWDRPDAKEDHGSIERSR